jgi:hypothetical protein
MTKQQLIAALEPYNDDAEIVASTPTDEVRWHAIHLPIYILEYEPITPDHVVIKIGDCVME